MIDITQMIRQENKVNNERLAHKLSPKENGLE